MWNIQFGLKVFMAVGERTQSSELTETTSPNRFFNCQNPTHVYFRPFSVADEEVYWRWVDLFDSKIAATSTTKCCHRPLCIKSAVRRRPNSEQ